VENPFFGGSLVYELVIPSIITIMEGKCWQSGDEILPVDSLSMSWKFQAESLFNQWRGSCGSPQMKNPPDGNKSRVPYYKGSLPKKNIFLKSK
jgi:hypothetical protein